MRKKKAKNSDEPPNAQNKKTAAKQTALNADFTSELREPRWSVVSFDERAAKNLTYEEAERKIAELENRKISGLCIITDEAAEKISN